ncbi:MAG TPA: ATP-binding cassette domain-containing protein, partial [Pseudomonas sp.]
MSVRLTGVGMTHANGRRALQEVDLTVSRGERLAIIGPSGAGKTTLLRLLATSLQPTEGRVELLGAEPWQLAAGAR